MMSVLRAASEALVDYIGLGNLHNICFKKSAYQISAKIQYHAHLVESETFHNISSKILAYFGTDGINTSQYSWDRVGFIPLFF